MNPSDNKDIQWIKNLVRMEQDMEASGQVHLPETKASVSDMAEHTDEFMKQLRTAFTSHSSVFNHMKGFLGSLRIYGIAGTKSDFMLFRHGHKLIFSVKEPGLITIKMNFNTAILMNNGEEKSEPADFIQAQWGPFNELKWTYNNKAINLDYLIRYYMSVFVKNSVK